MKQQQAVAVNLKYEEYDVRIDRRTKWGNHARIGVDGSRNVVILKYLRWLTNPKATHGLMDDLHELAGKRLGCHCKPKACHGDVLAFLVNLLEEG